MNASYLHLLMNHLPVLGSLFGLLLLLLAIGIKNEQLKRISLGCFVLVAVLTAPVYLTGEPAEHYIEDHQVPVEEAYVEPHEELAWTSFMVAGLLGLIALGGLVAFRQAPELPNWLIGVSVAGGLIVVVLMARTADLGGQIRHTEIRAAPPTSMLQGLPMSQIITT